MQVWPQFRHICPVFELEIPPEFVRNINHTVLVVICYFISKRKSERRELALVVDHGDLLIKSCFLHSVYGLLGMEHANGFFYECTNW